MSVVSEWPVEVENPDGSCAIGVVRRNGFRIIGVVRRGAQDEWHAHRNGHHVGVFRTKAEAIQRLKDLTPWAKEASQ